MRPDPDGYEWTAPEHRFYASPVGSINPEREARRRGADSDPLRLFERDFQLTACCRRSGCAHRRELTIGLLNRAFGREATLGQVAARMRCAKCGMRGAQIVVRYIGRWGDGR
jgi:hypothetical protein